ncbi:sulfhydryl oxidase 2 [Nasonia vitripennis]|uniref:Sulfhydryl oxidase n=1 Tax=Nasonia vitripennis TaxID=7425 RepID=A0A7M7GCN2_NASVI|nr:sulfhydryl oxidase 2 [Nasonia vitripennis]
MGRQLLLELVLIVFGLFLVGGFANVIPQKEQDEGNQGLYNSSDFVTILDVKNFKSSVYNSRKTWLVEFYNSWCGFCHRFAPIWKDVAKSIHGWKNIVVIAAIDCANDDNNPLCREYEVMRYPTLKFFPVNSKKDFLGLEVQKGNDEAQIIQAVIDQLVKEQQEQRGATSWPNLVPFRGTEIETLWHGVPQSVQYEFLIFEEPKSYLGAEVILELHKLDTIRIRRVTSENVFLSVTSKVTKFPSLIVIDRDNSQTFLKIDTITREGIRNVITEFLISKGISADIKDDIEETHERHPHKTISKDENEPEDSNNSSDKLYQLDLEATLRYSLNNEIPLSSAITGEKFKALKSYLKVLAEYFPVHMPKGKMYLQVLQEIVEGKKNITGKEFKGHVRDKEEKFMPVYSGPKTWIGCKGSSPTYRGYPCGLWTLFHTLTVAAVEESNGLNDNVPPVLAAMHGYIKYFFGCAECSDHFQKMAERRKLFDTHDGKESILWLWRAHNEVNERLAGDDTEDPEHKKIQYPSAQHCPECKRPNGVWDENEVLKFLKRKYSRRNIDFQGINDEILRRELDSSALSSGASQRKLGWDFTIFDISICVVLYVMSAAILTLVCIKFAFKRTYKKKVSFQNLLGIA